MRNNKHWQRTKEKPDYIKYIDRTLPKVTPIIPTYITLLLGVIPCYYSYRRWNVIGKWKRNYQLTRSNYNGYSNSSFEYKHGRKFRRYHHTDSKGRRWYVNHNGVLN